MVRLQSYAWTTSSLDIGKFNGIGEAVCTSCVKCVLDGRRSPPPDLNIRIKIVSHKTNFDFSLIRNQNEL